MSRRILIALLCALIASALGSGLWGVLAEAADGAAAEAPPPRRLPAGAMAEVDLSRGEAVFAFTAPSGRTSTISTPYPFLPASRANSAIIVGRTPPSPSRKAPVIIIPIFPPIVLARRDTYMPEPCRAKM